jgi:PAS domain S-box-containing protein
MKRDGKPNDLFYRSFDGFPDGILILDDRHHCLAINGSAVRLLGLPRSYRPSKKSIDRLQFVRELSGSLNRKQAGNDLERQFELRVTRPRARVRELGVRIRPNLTRGCHLVVLHDITGRKQTEEALRKHAQMLDLANDTIMIRDLNDHITYWNQGAERLYGWTKEQALGRYVHTFLKTKFPATLRSIFKQFLKDGRWEGVLEHTTADGSRVTVASRWTLEADEDGNPVAFLEINNDITEWKRAEEELQKVHAELERRVVERTAELSIANTRLRALSAKLIHAQEEERTRISRELHDDLGQILTAITLDLQRVLRHSGAIKENNLLDRVLAANQQARHRLRELSSLLRPRVLDEVGLNEAIETYIMEFQERTGVGVELSMQTGKTTISGAAGISIYRILQEALTNIARHARAHRVYVSLIAQGKKVTLRIKDDGVGFNPARARMERTLGLPGMRERATLLGGEFSLHSERGHGTEVLVSLPLKKQARLRKLKMP